MKCWHCQDSKKCDCISCGFDTRGKANRIERRAGACQWCKAVEFRKKHAAILEKFDPTDRRNWEYHPAADGNPVRRVYIPTKGLV